MEKRKFRHLTEVDRAQIEAWTASGVSQTDIAKKLGVHRSTITRELKRFTTPHGYKARMAHARHKQKRTACKPKRKVEQLPKISQYVLEHILRGWSPETISGTLWEEIEQGLRPVAEYVNHESIYQFVYESEFGKKTKLYQYLRRGQKRRRRRFGRKTHREILQNRVFIDERPEEVATRETVGHWEGDAIIYLHKKAINSLVERKTRFVILTKLEQKTALLTKRAVTSRLAHHYCKTVTVDNGSEHALHEEIAKELDIQVYFCHPYHSWEKGTNENMNGLVRRYLPRGTSIDDLTQEDLDAIADELNNRPRRILGYRTPKEVLESEYQKLNVAFRC